MVNLNLEGLNQGAAKRIQPFLKKVVERYHEDIHSIYIIGTSLTDDFDKKRSDINSIFILKEMDLDFLKFFAPLGKRYCKDRIAAPLIMTPTYIERSLDVFPIEFLNFKLIHLVVFGEDILKDIEIGRRNLRDQCERELKSRLIWLRQNYLSSMGNMKILAKDFETSILGYIPLFRGIITLFGIKPPVREMEVITTIGRMGGVDVNPFIKILKQKREGIRPSTKEIEPIFRALYRSVEKLVEIIDGIEE